MGARTFEIQPVRLLIFMAIGLAMGVSTYALTALRSADRAGVPPPATGSISQTEADASAVAEGFAAALNTIDYQEPDKWLDSLRPLTTDPQFEMLEEIYLPMSWGLLERERRVVTGDRVHVEDAGIQAQGRDWEIHLVDVEVAGLSRQAQVTRFVMYVLLSQDGADWRVASILTGEEVGTFSGAAQ